MIYDMLNVDLSLTQSQYNPVDGVFDMQVISRIRSS